MTGCNSCSRASGLCGTECEQCPGLDKIKHKIVSDTLDSVCLKCSQNYHGLCRAMCIPHSNEEREARSDGYGMECDPASLKLIRTRKYGVKYRT